MWVARRKITAFNIPFISYVLVINKKLSTVKSIIGSCTYVCKILLEVSEESK